MRASLIVVAHLGDLDYRPYYFDTAYIPAPYCYRCPYDKFYSGCGLECAWELETAIK